MARMSKWTHRIIRAGAVGAVALGIAGGVSWPGAATAAPASSGPASSGPASVTSVSVAPATMQASAHSCTNPLARTLYKAGFRGVNLREAWAIAMRESSGRDYLGPGVWDFNGNDWGLFQWNKPSWGGQSWWNDSKMLNGVYNARVAYRMSSGGQDWHLWGLDGRGRTNAFLYADYGWNSQQIYAWITQPYQQYYRQFSAIAGRCK